MNIEKTYYTEFDNVSTGRPYMVVPKVFGDNRGTFSEVLVGIEGLSEIKQINRSTSCKLALRGFHAQKAPYCQSKLVEAVTVPIIDIIIDARPDSKSFGLCEAFELDPAKQNKLYVPCGFLHAFFVPDWEEKDGYVAKEAVFMYYCNNVYDHASEFGISPASVIDKMMSIKQTDGGLSKFLAAVNDRSSIVMSSKDTNGLDYDEFMKSAKDEYQATGKCWYR